MARKQQKKGRKPRNRGTGGTTRPAEGERMMDDRDEGSPRSAS